MFVANVDDFSHDVFTLSDRGLLAITTDIAKPFVSQSVMCRVTLRSLSWAMKIRNILRKGLRRLVVEDDAFGIAAGAAPEIRRIVSFLQDMEFEEELRAISTWRAHQLTGNRKGV